MKNILYFLLILFLLFGSTTLNLSDSKKTRSFEWNGIVWTIMDRYTIEKYNSEDVPMELFNYTEKPKQILYEHGLK